MLLHGNRQSLTYRGFPVRTLVLESFHRGSPDDITIEKDVTIQPNLFDIFSLIKVVKEKMKNYTDERV